MTLDDSVRQKVARLRKDFAILGKPLTSGGKSRSLVYFDNAATTHKPKAVIDALVHYYENNNSNVHRAIHTLGEDSTRVFEEAREVVRDFLGASSVEEIVFTKGTTEAINLVASSLCSTFQAGDEIILTEMEHHSNMVPWQMAAKKYGLSLKFLPFDSKGELNLDDLSRFWTPKTRLVAITHMSNVLGTINDVKRAAQLVHALGGLILIDAAQSVPHMKVDVKDLDVDFLAFSSHKVCGPTGMGVLYGKKEHLKEMPPYHGGGEMIRSVTLEGYETNVLPYKFEAGTPHMEGAVGLAAALQYVKTVGLDFIHSYETLLVSYALEKMRTIPGLKTYGAAENRGGIVAFTLDGVHSHDVSAFLDQKGIAVRAGHHCAHPLSRKLGVVSTARASFYFYNTLEEVDTFCEALAEAGRVL